jgi:IS30 family transposase
MEEREEISRGLGQGLSLREIGGELGRNASTICREIHHSKRDRLTYRAVLAHQRSLRQSRQRRAGSHKLGKGIVLWRLVEAKLRQRWSPEQIAQWLKREYPRQPDMRVSAETIYTYLYVLSRGTLKKELLAALRRGHKHRRRRGRGQSLAPTHRLEEMLSIEERPSDVAERTVPGHWEGDLLIGRNRQSALGTLVERTTRTTILVPLRSKYAEEVRKAFAREIKRLPKQMRLTLTYDQGREMAQHKLFTKQTKMQVYFAHPASPWERGTNENTNGLIRQFFPKGTDFNALSNREIKRVQHLLNGRPRKVLNWYSPFEVMKQLLQ